MTKRAHLFPFVWSPYPPLLSCLQHVSRFLPSRSPPESTAQRLFQPVAKRAAKNMITTNRFHCAPSRSYSKRNADSARLLDSCGRRFVSSHSVRLPTRRRRLFAERACVTTRRERPSAAPDAMKQTPAEKSVEPTLAICARKGRWLHAADKVIERVVNAVSCDRELKTSGCGAVLNECYASTKLKASHLCEVNHLETCMRRKWLFNW